MSIACKTVYEVVAGVRSEGKKFDVPTPAQEAPAEAAESSGSSSIGENSDDGSGGVGSGSDAEEVQSSFKGALESLDALEESLPIRRGISKFYCGKSKSFTSLSEASSSSAKDIVKPDNAYSRKRKNLLAYKSIWERPNDNQLRNPRGDGISKRPTSSNRSTSNTENDCDNDQETHNKVRLLPPLHPPGKQAGSASTFGSSSPMKKCSFSMRSFSMMDLQVTSNSRPSTDPADNHNMFS
ncbi:hypothetical protein IHE45_18G078900 [Dioscorea alata]|uniref:Uncharacterized protein n=1 Tax=Dioscorea alata TaxID=55571 RepID=A0ACB7U8F6_DIOAL|nr:hypothetical protein IHE45_18G078900 [Dioscorea alata]